MRGVNDTEDSSGIKRVSPVFMVMWSCHHIFRLLIIVRRKESNRSCIMEYRAITLMVGFCGEKHGVREQPFYALPAYLVCESAFWKLTPSDK